MPLLSFLEGNETRLFPGVVMTGGDKGRLLLSCFPSPVLLS